MVKLGNNLSDKNNAKTVSEDGFDTIPLITPLDASQLQFPALDKVRFIQVTWMPIDAIDLRYPSSNVFMGSVFFIVWNNMNVVK